MKNPQATFQRMVNLCAGDQSNVSTYIDYINMYNNSWEEYLKTLQEVFPRWRKANLILSLSNSEFCRAKVTYFGHVVGYDRITPVNSKIQIIVQYPALTNV